MTRPVLRKKPSSRRLAPAIEPLEVRAMLSATPADVSAWAQIYRYEMAQQEVIWKAEYTADQKAERAAVLQARYGAAWARAASAMEAKAALTTSAPSASTAAAGMQAAASPSPTGLLSPVQSSTGTQNGASPNPNSFGATQLRAAYGLDDLPDEGQGQTIAIIDLFDDPKIASDTAVYSAEYGLPQLDGRNGDGTLTIHKMGNVPASPTSGGFETTVETSLDVQMAHAMAPKANILLVETNYGLSASSNLGNLVQGVQYAATHGASVASVSYGYFETYLGKALETALNNTYLATGPAAGIAVTVSSGDATTPEFPANSPNVIAVGGTSLYLTPGGQYDHETAWGNGEPFAGGGGPSLFFTPPAYQSSNGINYATRTVPDVSMEADPYPGINIYDSYDGPGWEGGWGGTSVASPLFAGILALSQEQRADAGKSILNSAQIDGAMYAASNSPNYLTYLHDITQGDNQDIDSNAPYYAAAPGYDLATGIGSPKADTLVPYLASV